MDVVDLRREGDTLQAVTLIIWTEPEVQVRMTTNSARYKIPAIRYNGWKRRVSEAVKRSVRKAYPEMPWFRRPAAIRCTIRVHVSNGYRLVNGDLDNFTKAAKDMLNACARVWDREAWPDSTEPRPIWDDDCQVWQKGYPEGKFWAPTPAESRLEIELERIDVIMPEKRKTVADHKKDIWKEVYENTRHREDAIRGDLDPADRVRWDEAMAAIYAEMLRKAGIPDA